MSVILSIVFNPEPWFQLAQGIVVGVFGEQIGAAFGGVLRDVPVIVLGAFGGDGGAGGLLGTFVNPL